MAKRSAGVLLYRYRDDALELLLLHPGGPFWAKKDLGAWSIPKGEIDEDEDEEAAARREFQEETGFALEGELAPLGAFRQLSGKTVVAFACAGDADTAAFSSNVCEIEWPPGTGRRIQIPEADRAQWFPPDDALSRVVKGQRGIIEALLSFLAAGSRP